ncbi:MAG TPA: hemerythrin domain-containing protein [Sedimenticola thiotaurini]|uniref:Hemerythrin domain-containing protein n=1 Tax=Sedimenticola thiotaurini TaxID=1543721 RepID=A0A831RKV6_9GAMM|nr:hemerythrin domain-containing protein [Sedimenticola thiotaurini]
MKRSEQLKKLSWEHHDALKFARNVGHGLRRGADLREVADYAVYVTDHFLTPHFRLEEEALIARLDQSRRALEPVQRVLEEHRGFARLRQQLADAGEADLPELLARFRDLLRGHVRLEENQLFPLLERELSADQLDQAKAEIDARHISACEEWGRSFLG